jgi:hypothetical protein
MITDLIRVIQRRCKRFPMHLAIRGLVSWEPQANQQPGYTVVIACMHKLAHLAVANLNLIQRMDAEGLKEVLLVFDCLESELPAVVRDAVANWRSGPEVRVVCYGERQVRAARKINWGWVYSWMSWTKGIAEAGTRHVLLHDLDALPLEPNLFLKLYSRALKSGAQFQGIRQYRGQGITPDMGLVTTFELMIDAYHMRKTFQPFEGFNRVCLIGGRYVDFDTFLYMQHRSSLRAIQSIDESQLVHPTQMICQYTDFMAGRGRISTHEHNLIMLPYYFLLGGDPDLIASTTKQLTPLGAHSLTMMGRSLPIGHLAPTRWAWIEKQIRRVEQAIFGRTRPPVESFLSTIIPRAADQRTVGQEGVNGIPEL